MVLDLAAGTGTSSEPFADAGATVVPCDFSLGMLQVGKKARPGLPFTAGDATQLPFPDDTFDAVTISFGLRNVVDPAAGLTEMRRVTRPGGRLVVCEFSHPTYAPWRTVYLEYLMKALPTIARGCLLLAGRLRLPRRVHPGLARPGRPGCPPDRRRVARHRVAQPFRRDRRAAPRHRLMASPSRLSRERWLSSSRTTGNVTDYPAAPRISI